MNNIALVISAGILFIEYIIVYIMKAIPQKKVDRVIYSVFFVFSLTLIAASFDFSKVGFDIVRHVGNIEYIRNNNISFYNYFSQFNSSSDFLIVYKLIIFIIARLGLPEISIAVISAVIYYSSFLYILTDFRQKESLSFGNVLPAVFICFCLMPFHYVITGIRNAMAFAITGFGIYKYLYCKKSLFFSLFLILIATLIHPSSLFVVPALLFSKIRKWPILYFTFFLGSFFISKIANIISVLNIPFFSQIASSYLFYESDNQYKGSSYFLIADLFVLISFTCILLRKKVFLEKSKKSSDLYNFIFLFILFTLGQIGNYDLILRPCYFLGLFSFQLMTLSGSLSYKNKYRESVFRLLIYLVCGFVIIRYMSFFLFNTFWGIDTSML